MVKKYLFLIIVTFIIVILYFNILGYSSYFICGHRNQDKRPNYTILENFDLFGPQKGLFGKIPFYPVQYSGASFNQYFKAYSCFYSSSGSIFTKKMGLGWKQYVALWRCPIISFYISYLCFKFAQTCQG